MRPHVVAWLAARMPMSVAQVLAPTWFTMVGLAGVIALVALLRHARADRVDRGAVATVVIVGYLAAIAGGIAIPALIELVERAVAGQPVRLRPAGMTSFWGYTAGTIAVIEGCRRGAVSVGWLADRATPALGVALALIRVGCFLAGCDFGQVSGAPWAVRFPAGSAAWHDHVSRGLVPATRAASLPVHPTQLYEALVGVVIAIAAAVITRRRARVGRGHVFLGAAAAYCVARLGIEAMRGDRVRGFVLGASSGQVFALVALAVIAATVLTQRRSRLAP